MTIFHAKDTRVGYIEEVTFGSLPASPTLQPITLTSVLTRGLDAGNITISALGDAKPKYILKGLHEPFMEVEFYLQNGTFPTLIEDVTKSYSIVVYDPTGTDMYRVYEGCRAGALDINVRVREAARGTMVFVPKSFRNEASISGLSWASEWTETPLAWYNARVELLTEVTGESPSGSGTGPYTCANSPFCDRDEDGTIDDVDDITVYDNSVEEAAASVDSSAGTFMLTEAPVGAVTCDYVYETNLAYILELRYGIQHNMDRYPNISLTGDKARDIKEGACEITGDITYTFEGSTITDAILATTKYWGLQLKFGAGENGTLRFRMKDDFQWNIEDNPSETDSILTARTGMSANNYNIF